eukprot:TRINITY_DN62804_c0_g1_i1.p1 TRINITY_DN62804_c0_g1~~TRINITY_DN62804_c0_g1_i1.p1  ORF type:complete len:472 (-),score=48.35 TRINITY_DN62804_c0_g1_i1:68-1483(-)
MCTSYQAAYEPYVDVETVSIDAFLFDAEDLRSDVFRRKQKQLISDPELSRDLPGAKRHAAQKVGELSARTGSFWVDYRSCIHSEEARPQTSVEEASSNSFRDQVIDSCRELFLNVDANTKRVFQVDNRSGKIGRGYLPLGGESGSGAVFENKEGFAFGYARWPDAGTKDIGEEETDGLSPGEDRNTSSPAAPRQWNRMEAYNVWPETSASAEDSSKDTTNNGSGRSSTFSTTSRYVLESDTLDFFSDLATLLIRAYSLDLHGDETVLLNNWAGGESWSLTRIFRYFKSVSEDQSARISALNEKQIGLGSSPHTDWGLLTFILACDEPGLQLLATNPNRNNQEEDKDQEQWVTVRPEFGRNRVFVNTGDFMALLSNGKYHSPRHRVVSPVLGTNREHVERTSVVHFYYPKYDVLIPEISPELQKKYSTFADQRDLSVAQSGSEKTTEEISLVTKRDRLFGDWIAEKWTQVAR